MSDPTPTLIKTSELDKWFNIGKNTRVNRLAMLGLTPDRLLKEGRSYYLNQEQLDLFTDFDKYILETGSSDGYPKLFSVYSDNPTIPNSLIEGDIRGQVEPVDSRQARPPGDRQAGQLTTTSQDLDVLASLAGQSDIFASVTGEFTGTLPVDRFGALAEHLAANAPLKATAMLLAENALAEQYINNPHLLNPELRAQLDNFQYSKIDPKGLAASLVASAQRQMKAA